MKDKKNQIKEQVVKIKHTHLMAPPEPPPCNKKIKI